MYDMYYVCYQASDSSAVYVVSRYLYSAGHFYVQKSNSKPTIIIP